MRDLLRKRLLWVAATDSTFELIHHRGEHVLSGRCIHCRRRLLLREDGSPISDATLEHIIPRNHGGTNASSNLAIACGGCNSQKGRKLDCRRFSDPDLQRVIGHLQAQRRERWRPAPDTWDLPQPPVEWEG